jgi:sugar phosphate isomerase/epimerase
MDAWQVGLSTGCFFRTSIFEVMEPIRSHGISVIEICSYPAHLDYHDTEKVRAAAERLASSGLQPFSFHAPFADHIDISAADVRRRQGSIAEMLAAVEAAAALGARHFVIHPGPEREGGANPEEHLRMLRNSADSLLTVAGECARHGIKLLLENMLPHLFLGKTADLKWLMREIRAANPGFCLDTGHAHLGGNLSRLVELFGPELTMIHAADNRGINDDHLPPGKGGIDWRQLFRLLRAVDFQGIFIVELAGDTGADPETTLAEALGAQHFIAEIANGLD